MNGLFFTVLFAVLTAVDTALALRQYGELNSFLETVRSFFSLYGVYLDQIGYGILFMLLSVLLSVLSTIAVAYFSITIGHTLFRDKKWRWLPSLVLFFALTWAINWLIGQFPTAWDQMVVVNSSVGDGHGSDGGHGERHGLGGHPVAAARCGREPGDDPAFAVRLRRAAGQKGVAVNQPPRFPASGTGADSRLAGICAAFE